MFAVAMADSTGSVGANLGIIKVIVIPMKITNKHCPTLCRQYLKKKPCFILFCSSL